MLSRLASLLIFGLALAGCSTNSPSVGGGSRPQPVTQNEDDDTRNLGGAANLDSLTNVIKANPDDARSYNKRGMVYGKIGRLQDAFNDFNKAISLNPNLTEAYVNRAVVLVQMKRYEPALTDYNRALSHNPNSAAALRGRGTIHRIQGRFDEALTDYNRSIAVLRNNPQAFHNRGLIYQAQGNHKQALEDFTTALGFAPYNRYWKYDAKFIKNCNF